uniref:Uncharacterized protein n=1 Tax=Spongospora subterranea TaxID=70186 RepID=A0A0H5R5L3_9EUKA|eukprot:CRZ09423.1 hypothetical protein [Spongospora subterranea]
MIHSLSIIATTRLISIRRVVSRTSRYLSTSIDDTSSKDEKVRQLKKQLYQDNKDRISSMRQQRVLVAGLSGLPVSHFSKKKTYGFTVPQLLKQLDENRTINVRVFKLGEVSTLCNFLVVASTASNRHIQAVAQNVAREARLKNAGCVDPSFTFQVEGEASDEWMCLDMGSIVLHLMSDHARQVNDIESMYRDYQIYGDPLPPSQIGAETEDGDEPQYRAIP